MITPFQVYMLAMLDRIQALGIIAAILAGLLSALELSKTSEPLGVDPPGGVGSKTSKRFIRRARMLAAVCVIMTVGAFMCPTTKEAAAIIAIPKIANSETVAELGESVKVLTAEWLEELRPNKKEESK